MGSRRPQPAPDGLDPLELFLDRRLPHALAVGAALAATVYAITTALRSEDRGRRRRYAALAVLTGTEAAAMTVARRRRERPVDHQHAA